MKFFERLSYQPNLGYIGSKSVRVSNYFFDKEPSRQGERDDLKNIFMGISTNEHHKRSKKMEKFLFHRGLTFSKKTKKGYKNFSVPVTSTPLILPQAQVERIERAAQILVFSLRRVLQSIYGAPDIQSSAFVRFLPEPHRSQFIKTIESSAHYVADLHHANMLSYPFFDSVGLDLVMTDDTGKRDFPFQILEINAGSPSGASNNHHLIEALLKFYPEYAQCNDRFLKNDHFEKLGETYRNLGQAWTASDQGIAIVIPPGGSNGATPEIQQLAAKSGLLYVEANHLYLDASDNLRVKTITGNDPRVTSIYSRVNTDSLLFDANKNLLLRDPENGKPVYLEDQFLPKRNGHHPPLRDVNGKEIPAPSSYQIPDAIRLIQERKLYIGGLNRILDNKIILPLLSIWAPRFCEAELSQLGLSLEQSELHPPKTLPSNDSGYLEVRRSPEEWVIKAPELSGGSGVHILRCLNRVQRKAVLDTVAKHPDAYTYQKLVRLGRLPVAEKRGTGRAEFKNRAADIRLWVLFGGESIPSLPIITRNGLVRVAPNDSSSIVNTSQGGGYAPLLIRANSTDSRSQLLSELKRDFAPTAEPSLPQIKIDPPVFVAAQLVQVRKILEEIESCILSTDSKCSGKKVRTLISDIHALRLQVHEIGAYLAPNQLEPLGEILERIKDSLPEDKIQSARLALVKKFAKLDTKARLPLLSWISNPNTTQLYKKPLPWKPLESWVNANHFGDRFLSASELDFVREQLGIFRRLLQNRLANHSSPRYSEIIEKKTRSEFLKCSPILPYTNQPINLDSIPVASLYEFRTGTSIIESEWVASDLRTIRNAWLKISNPTAIQRRKHLESFPQLQELQSLILESTDSATDSKKIPFSLLRALPWAHYNLAQFAKLHRISIEEAFSDHLQEGTFGVLTHEQRIAAKIENPFAVGECFARRKKRGDSLSDSEILLWVRAELPWFQKITTLGHELVHYHQIRDLFQLERKSKAQSPVDYAEFISYFGMFLSNSFQAVDANSTTAAPVAAPVYGMADLKLWIKDLAWVKELFQNYRLGPDSFFNFAHQLGAQLGAAFPVNHSLRVKAIREVIPAFENYKNLNFLIELGLELPVRPIDWLLPSANESEKEAFLATFSHELKKPVPSPSCLLAISQHQILGVLNSGLVLEPIMQPIYPGEGYSDAQQQ